MCGKIHQIKKGSSSFIDFTENSENFEVPIFANLCSVYSIQYIAVLLPDYSYRVNTLHAGSFFCLFIKMNFFKTFKFRNTTRVSNDLEPDMDLGSVSPDQEPNCLQRLSAGNKSRLWHGMSYNKTCLKGPLKTRQNKGLKN